MWLNDDEINEAKKHDAYSYLRLADPYELVRLSCREYCLKSHDSFKLSQKNGVWLWYWYSRGFGGRSAVDYLIKVKGYAFTEAVKEVNRVMKGTHPSFFIEKEKGKTFRLPAQNSNADTAVSYLCSRGIDKELIEELIDAGMIFQNKKHQSVVFVGFDDNGKPAHAAYRATQKGQTAKGDYAASNKEYAFRLERKNADTVRVFESAIDLLSYITLCKIQGREFSSDSLISTAGISASGSSEVKLPLALESYLKRHPETKHILLHFDNDFTGIRCTEQIKQKLSNDFQVRSIMPKQGKDYNEYLQNERRKENERKNDDRCDHGRANGEA